MAIESTRHIVLDLIFVVKREGSQYSALCLDLDIAACGDTEGQSIDVLKSLIEDYVMHMAAEGREDQLRRPVSPEALREFLSSSVPKGASRRFGTYHWHPEIPAAAAL